MSLPVSLSGNKRDFTPDASSDVQGKDKRATVVSVASAAIAGSSFESGGKNAAEFGASIDIAQMEYLLKKDPKLQANKSCLCLLICLLRAYSNNHEYPSFLLRFAKSLASIHTGHLRKQISVWDQLYQHLLDKEGCVATTEALDQLEEYQPTLSKGSHLGCVQDQIMLALGFRIVEDMTQIQKDLERGAMCIMDCNANYDRDNDKSINHSVVLLAIKEQSFIISEPNNLLGKNRKTVACARFGASPRIWVKQASIRIKQEPAIKEEDLVATLYDGPTVTQSIKLESSVAVQSKAQSDDYAIAYASAKANDKSDGFASAYATQYANQREAGKPPTYAKA